MHKIILFCLISFAILAGSSATGRPRSVLKVALYPYISDIAGDSLQGLVTYLETHFEHLYPDIDLQLDFSNDPYNVNATSELLTTGGYHIAEIDTILLGAYKELIQETPALHFLPDGYFFPGSLEMVKLNGDFYGIPTYLCTNYLFSYDRSINSVRTYSDLIHFLNTRGQGKIGLATDLKYYYDLTLFYADGFLDAFNTLTGAFDVPVNQHVFDQIKTISETCKDPTDPTINRCLDGEYYNNPQIWFDEFVSGRSLALFGFSEYLANFILSGGGRHPYIISPPLAGHGNRPYLFTDAFVFSKANVKSPRTIRDSYLFTSWYVNWALDNLILGKDSPQSGTFRYLLSAKSSFYNRPEVRRDRSYVKFWALVQNTVPLPNNKYPLQNSLFNDLCTGLGNC